MKSPIITNATKNAQLPESVEAGKAITIQLAPEGLSRGEGRRKTSKQERW